MKTEILGHDVKWWVERKTVKELDSTSLEHIDKAIRDGCVQGELHVSYGKNGDKTTSGWWQIVNWQSIALELYNALIDSGTNPSTSKKIDALKKFNENW